MLVGAEVAVVGAAARAMLTGRCCGGLDPSFGAGGSVVTDFGGFDLAAAIAIQADGRLVAAGVTDNGFALTRYTPNGRPDRSFGTDGRVITSIGDDGGAIRAVAVGPDGSIVAAGQAFIGPKVAIAIARYNPDGSLRGGIVTTIVGNHSFAAAVAIRPDGSIVTAGESDGRFLLARYDRDGCLDPSFGSAGTVATAIGAISGIGAMALQSDGKLVAVGRSQPRPGLAPPYATVVRYNENGTVDTSFGTAGVLIAGESSDANAVAIQADGKIIVAGARLAGRPRFMISRCTAAGGLDASFGGSGAVTGPHDIGAATAVAVQADGRVVAVGYRRGKAELGTALVRYDPDGGLDATFGQRGTVTVPGEVPSGLVLQGDGKIVVVGDSGTGGDFVVTRYLARSGVRCGRSGQTLQRVA